MNEVTRSLTLGDLKWSALLRNPRRMLLVPHIRKIFGYTQLNHPALMQLDDIVTTLDRGHTPGAIVEMGCGRGGAGALMAYLGVRNRNRRDIWLFDSFEGLSEPVGKDVAHATKEPEKIKQGYLKVSSDLPLHALRSIGVDESATHIVKGWFEETVPGVKDSIGDIALLRLDADLYEPTIYALRELYPKLVSGGYVIIDDYRNWVGARRAVYEYFVEQNIAPQLRFFWYGGPAYFRKD